MASLKGDKTSTSEISFAMQKQEDSMFGRKEETQLSGLRWFHLF